jgi:hypothetical protein
MLPLLAVRLRAALAVYGSCQAESTVPPSVVLSTSSCCQLSLSKLPHTHYSANVYKYSCRLISGLWANTIWWAEWRGFERSVGFCLWLWDLVWALIHLVYVVVHVFKGRPITLLIYWVQLWCTLCLRRPLHLSFINPCKGVCHTHRVSSISKRFLSFRSSLGGSYEMAFYNVFGWVKNNPIFAMWSIIKLLKYFLSRNL